MDSMHNIKGVLHILGAILFAKRLVSRKYIAGTEEFPIPVTDLCFLEEP